MGEVKLLAADMAMTEEQQSMPLREAVFMSLRKAILTGKLKPGERLTEVKLGKLLGTSRTPIREAIRKLELEGLVTIIPGSGARVSGMTVEDLQEVMQVLSALEQLSAGLASERITGDEKEHLRDACNAFIRSTQNGDSLAIAEADVRFHEVILKAAKNETELKNIRAAYRDDSAAVCRFLFWLHQHVENGTVDTLTEYLYVCRKEPKAVDFDLRKKLRKNIVKSAKNTPELESYSVNAFLTAISYGRWVWCRCLRSRVSQFLRA